MATVVDLARNNHYVMNLDRNVLIDFDQPIDPIQHRIRGTIQLVEYWSIIPSTIPAALKNPGSYMAGIGAGLLIGAYLRIDSEKQRTIKVSYIEDWKLYFEHFGAYNKTAFCVNALVRGFITLSLLTTAILFNSEWHSFPEGVSAGLVMGFEVMGIIILSTQTVPAAIESHEEEEGLT